MSESVGQENKHETNAQQAEVKSSDSEEAPNETIAGTTIFAKDENAENKGEDENQPKPPESPPPFRGRIVISKKNRKGNADSRLTEVVTLYDLEPDPNRKRHRRHHRKRPVVKTIDQTQEENDGNEMKNVETVKAGEVMEKSNQLIGEPEKTEEEKKKEEPEKVDKDDKKKESEKQEKKDKDKQESDSESKSKSKKKEEPQKDEKTKKEESGKLDDAIDKNAALLADDKKEKEPKDKSKSESDGKDKSQTKEKKEEESKLDNVLDKNASLLGDAKSKEEPKKEEKKEDKSESDSKSKSKSKKKEEPKKV